MALKHLKPKRLKALRVETPQCCVPVDPPAHDKEWRRTRYSRLRPEADPDRCQRESSLVIEGRPYCRPHAAAYALELWEAGKLIRKR